jgi:predicted methyltransferase
MFSQCLAVVIVANLAVLTTAAAKAEDAPRSKGPTPYAAKMSKEFTDPNADIQEFVKRFETEAREVCAKRREITRAVGLRPGDAVADIGAGAGLFTQLFAEQVGPKGTVYAVDISPAFVKYIAEARERTARPDRSGLELKRLHASPPEPAQHRRVANPSQSPPNALS